MDSANQTLQHPAKNTAEDTNAEYFELPGLGGIKQTNTSADDVWEYGDVIMDILSQQNVEYVFGVPGGAIEPLYNALARSERNEGPKAIISRHELGAAAMANGYARESGRLGVCCATAGPGATNLLTGVACAYTDGIPLLAITAQTAIKAFGKGSAQDSSCTGVDTLAMYNSCTVYNSLVSHPDQLEHKLLTAISLAFSSTPGPAHLAIPLDILRQSAPRLNKQHYANVTPYTEHETLPNPNLIATLKHLLEKVDNGVILVGQDAEPAIYEVLAFAHQKNWPIVTTPMGKGLISAFHPLNKGVYGLAGHTQAYDSLKPENADIIIAVGTGLDECASGGWDKNLLSSRLIHIDSNPKHIARSYMGCLSILGSPKYVFQELLNSRQALTYTEVPLLHADFPSYQDKDDQQKCLESTSNTVKPQQLFWQLSRKCPTDARVTLDTGNSFLWGIHYWQCRKKMDFDKNLFHISIGFGPMGWALGASVGIAFALEQKKPVICFVGDGSVLMNGQEITAAQQHGLNILFVVLNDASLGTVKHGQRLANAEQIGYELPQVNYSEVATAMGVRALRIQSTEELTRLDVETIMSQPGPCVLEVMVDGEEVPPLGLRMKMLGTAKNKASTSSDAKHQAPVTNQHATLQQKKVEQTTTASPATPNNDSLNATSGSIKDVINSTIWLEEPEDDNPFAAAKCFCHGYDVYNELIAKISWIEYIYLMFCGEVPQPSAAKLLEKIAIAIANPGPREASVRAAMNAGVGGSPWAAALSASLAVGAGQFGGGREVFLVMQKIKQNHTSIDAWSQSIKHALNRTKEPTQSIDIWPDLDHMPGFDPNGVVCTTPVLQTLSILAHESDGPMLQWILENRQLLENMVGYPLSMTGVIGCAFHDLGFTPEQAEILYLLLRLPGAAVHAYEQNQLGYKQYPFFKDSVHLMDDPGERKPL